MIEGAVIAVTGGTGFLGRHLVGELVRREARVRALVRTPRRAARLPAGVDLAWGDVTSPVSLAPFADGADAIVHAAAAISGPLHELQRVNHRGTANIVAAAGDAGVGHLIHISTVAAYGFEGSHFPETRPLRPSNQSYSMTKAAAERAVTEGDVAYTVLRPGGIFGPGAWFWSARYARRARRKPTIFLGSGQGNLAVIHVADVVDLICTVLEEPAARHQAFNASLDPAPTVRQYHHAYGRLFGNESWVGVPASVLRAPARLAAAVAPAHSYLAEAPQMLAYLERPKRYPMEKARNLLGWEPRLDLDEGVAATAPWLRQVGIA